MATDLSAAPALSTPADHLFEHIEPEVSAAENEAQAQRRSHDELLDIYEIARTAREIRADRWKRIALQFPDTMLGDAPWVVQALNTELASLASAETSTSQSQDAANKDGTNNGTAATAAKERIYILADTSYSSCCVDEIAAEHVNADIVVHYGRSCLSPTSRLPVIYVFTQHKLEHATALEEFEKEYPEKEAKVVLMADVTYQDHLAQLASELCSRGYVHLLSTAIVHDPTGRIPNRKIIHSDGAELGDDCSSTLDLQEYSIFHISQPPTALLLALSSRVKSLYILPTSSASSSSPSAPRLLGCRYARCLSLATAGIIGILVNTLSVSNYLASIDSIRKQIAAKGKKSYTVVVGKLNPAKLANFAEVDGWVVVGCWESSLVEDDSGYFKPVITPFELDVALAGDEHRVWTGEWWGGIEGVKPFDDIAEKSDGTKKTEDNDAPVAEEQTDDEEESEPPEFDLRTGRLISHSRPMRAAAPPKAEGAGTDGVSTAAEGGVPKSGALALRPKAELATVNGVVSPGAEYLRSQRTWQGLGSDFTLESSSAIEEGRSGVARGYTVGEDTDRR